MLYTGVGATANLDMCNFVGITEGEIKSFSLELKFEMDFRHPNHINHYL